MSGTWDATILSAYAADTDGLFAVDAVGNGERIRRRGQRQDRREPDAVRRPLRTVRVNPQPGRSTTMLTQHQQYTLAPQKLALSEAFRVQFASRVDGQRGRRAGGAGHLQGDLGDQLRLLDGQQRPVHRQGPSPAAAGPASG